MDKDKVYVAVDDSPTGVQAGIKAFLKLHYECVFKSMELDKVKKDKKAEAVPLLDYLARIKANGFTLEDKTLFTFEGTTAPSFLQVLAAVKVSKATKDKLNAVYQNLMVKQEAILKVADSKQGADKPAK